MNNDKKNLKGSSKRDEFKWAHKNQGKMAISSFYCTDIDFAFISNNPEGIIAYIDYKDRNDSVSFTERIAYDELATMKPVYIAISSDPLNGPFEINEYSIGGILKPVCNLAGWDEWQIWEAELRKQYKNNGR